MNRAFTMGHRIRRAARLIRAARRAFDGDRRELAHKLTGEALKLLADVYVESE